MKEIKSLSPFKRLCMTIGNLPSSYIDSMSYYECLVWLCDYLAKTVVPAVNNNAEALEELQDYVKNYFNNLDVQEEINKKLDSMVISGELQQLIDNQYKELKAEVNNSITNIETTLTNGLNRQDNSIEVLQRQITNLSNGSPIPVNSISQMTDTNKIYVLVSSGKWYYNNGSNWVIGGDYQTQQSSDTTNNILNYLKIPQAKYLMDWIVGDVNNQGIVSSNYRIATNSIQHFDFDIYMPQDDLTKTYLWVYSDANGTNPTAWGWIQSGTKGYTIPKGTYFRLLKDYNDVAERTDISGQNAFNTRLFANTNVYKYYEYQDSIIKLFNKTNDDNLKYNITFVTGDIASNNGKVYIQDQFNRRIVSQDIIKLDYDLFIPKGETGVSSEIYLCEFSDYNGSNFVSKGWVNKFNDYTIPAGTYFRLLVSNFPDTSTDLVNDIFTSDVFNNLKLYKKKETNEVNIIEHNNNCKSIAHQGYSTTSQYYGNSRISSYIGAKLHGFDFGECDIKWSSDNIPVCCHDNSFVSGDDTIVISEHTLSELKTYNYYGEHIASLEEVIITCKKLGLGLYIDQLPDFDSSKFDIIFGLIDKYQMANNIVFLTTNESSINYILNKYNNAKISLVISETSSIDSMINLANRIDTNLNTISLDLNYSNYSYNNIVSIKNRLNSDISIEVWTIDEENTYLNYLPYVSAITSNKYCYNDIYQNYI